MPRSMGRWIILACALLIVSGCGSRKTTGETATLRVGAAITATEPVDIAELAVSPEGFVGRTVRLEGTVLNVCQGSGCWVEVQAPDGASFIAKSLDHSVVLPADCQGRRIVVQGVVTAMEPEAPAGDEGEQTHGACEGGEKHSESEAPHECPKPTYLVSMTGAELRN